MKDKLIEKAWLVSNMKPKASKHKKDSKKKLKKYLNYHDGEFITIKDLKKLVKYTSKDTQVVLSNRRWSFVITNKGVELGVTDGEVFQTAIRKYKKDIFVIPDIKSLLLDAMINWNGDLKKMYKSGMNKKHPLYVGY